MASRTAEHERNQTAVGLGQTGGGAGREGHARGGPRGSGAAGYAAALERIPAWTITAVLGLAYVLAAPPSTDLAAAVYRSDLFAHAGFTLWDNSWYAGHHLPAYSLLAPALGAWLGPQLLAALSMTLATALFALLIDGFFSPRATRIAALWFAVGASLSLLSNRVPFDLGLALGLASLLAARYRWRIATPALAVLCSLASPVAGAFLALAYVTWALARASGAGQWARAGRRASWPLALALATLAPLALLALTFPEGGTQPFAASAFYPGLVGVLLIAALIPGARSERAPGEARVQGISQAGATPEEARRLAAARRMVRVGALLYALALLGAYAIPTAIGSNADRLGALVAGPVAACLLIGWRPRWLVLALAPFLLYWQANAPITDFVSAAEDPAVHASYYAPLVRELRSLGVGYSARPVRIEAVPTADHGEARYLAPDFPLARGWERQLDEGRDAIFYEHQRLPLSAARYRQWLSQMAVSYVALPDAPLDYSATAEARLLLGATARDGDLSAAVDSRAAAAPPGYLREIWRSAHWRLFAVLDPRPLVQRPATMTRLSEGSFTIAAPATGSYAARVRFTPYWAVAGGHGCVREAPGGWTDVQARGAGEITIAINFSLARIFEHGPRCR